MDRARRPGGERVLRTDAALTTRSDGQPRAGRAARFWHGLTCPARWAALVAGALPVLAFPSLNLEILGWIGLVPGLLVLRAAPTARESAVRGWWLGTGYLLMAMYWLTPNLGPAVLLIAIVLGLPWAGVGLAAWGLLRRPTVLQALAALVVLPSCWVVTDWIRSWQGIGGPWAVFGASQWQHPVVLALAAVGGIWLITIVLVAANTAIVIMLTAASLAGRAVGAAGALLAIGAAPTAFALTSAEYAVPAAGHLTISLVQPGLEPTPPQTVVEGIRLTARAPRADLVVCGESSVGYDLRTS